MDKYRRPADESEAVREIHEFLFKPLTIGGKSRAEQMDNLLAILRSGKMSARVLVWVGGGALAVIGAYNTIAATLLKWGGGQ